MKRANVGCALVLIALATPAVALGQWLDYRTARVTERLTRINFSILRVEIAVDDRSSIFARESRSKARSRSSSGRARTGGCTST